MDEGTALFVCLSIIIVLFMVPIMMGIDTYRKDHETVYFERLKSHYRRVRK